MMTAEMMPNVMYFKSLRPDVSLLLTATKKLSVVKEREKLVQKDISVVALILGGLYSSHSFVNHSSAIGRSVTWLSYRLIIDDTKMSLLHAVEMVALDTILVFHEHSTPTRELLRSTLE